MREGGIRGLFGPTESEWALFGFNRRKSRKLQTKKKKGILEKSSFCMWSLRIEHGLGGKFL